MHRAAVRPASRRALGGLLRGSMRAVPQRSASTAAPADKPRSWKSSALRWGLAIGAVYYYSTSSIFADDDDASEPRMIPAPSSFAESDTPTVDALVEEKRKQAKAQLEADEQKRTAAMDTERQPGTGAQNAAAAEASPAALEEEAGQEGAFNPETGEINWDCPCLGGMAHGPCGEDFKAAFSCFVYSNEEPKGMDCIDKFQAMQECFRKYPDIYGAELTDEELADDDDANGAAQPAATEPQALREAVPEPAANDNRRQADNMPRAKSAEASAPKKWEDARAANDEVTRAEAEDREPESERELATRGNSLRKDVSEPAAKDTKPQGDTLPMAKFAEARAPKKWEDARAANDEVTKAEAKGKTDES